MKPDQVPSNELARDPIDAREAYTRSMDALRQNFRPADGGGLQAIRERADAVDALVCSLWNHASSQDGNLASGIAVLATGGYGRRELFPSSDLDLIFLTADSGAEKPLKDSIKKLNQQLWDSGVRVSGFARTLADCDRFDPLNLEFTLSLFDLRFLAGDQVLAAKLTDSMVPKLLDRERKPVTARLLEMVRERHARYGDTLFHLEPNIKESPGGVRDANTAGWLQRLSPHAHTTTPEFHEAFGFLASVRVFLHLRHGRDSNSLDWKSQDACAAAGVGTPAGEPCDAAYWMQLYFRHARVVARQLEQQMEALPRAKPLLRLPQTLRRRSSGISGISVERGRIELDAASGTADPARDPDTVFRAFQVMAETGARLTVSSENRIEAAVPVLSSALDEGAALWQRLRLVLAAPHAGDALRAMHALGLLELLLPEFHGIDALVIRDAYHRYTVDEHTFVLIDTLHGLLSSQQGALGEWAKRFGAILRDVEHTDLLMLAALLHDTGKGRSSGEHTVESARLAASVVERLELDEFESSLVLDLIMNHLEMSSALRRDIFDSETIRSFAGKVQTPEQLRMLTLFTYADIQAVHPDALTPWKAENLWRLYIGASNFLDRNIDEERFDSRVSSEVVHRVTTLLPQQSREVLQFLQGFPQRYLRTRSPEQIRNHFQMNERVSSDPVQLDFHWTAERSEITIVTPDRSMLFARIAGVLAAWGMNIITADAFSNATGIVVDSFRFTDSFKTLEMNPGERDRLLANVHDAITDPDAAAKMFAMRKRSRRREPLVKVDTSVEFDTQSSTHSTLLQVVAQDLSGLLYSVATTLSEAGCNIEVAVIDTEGDMAIDVFYLTRNGEPLDDATLPALRDAVLSAIACNA